MNCKSCGYNTFTSRDLAMNVRFIPYPFKARETLTSEQSVKSRLYYSRERLVQIKESILNGDYFTFKDVLKFACPRNGRRLDHTIYCTTYYKNEDGEVEFNRIVSSINNSLTSFEDVITYNSTIDSELME
jgi:hypothetical protein